MKYVEDILYIEFNEAVKAGIKSETIKKASYRQSDSWVIMKDPDDSRKLLIRFDTLKPRYRKILEAHYGSDITQVYYANFVYQSPYFHLPSQVINWLETYQLPDGRKLPQNYKEKYRQDARYINFLLQMQKADRAWLQYKGFKGLTHLKEVVRALIKADKKASLPASRRHLDEILKNYNPENPQVLVSRHLHRFGNTRRTKITGRFADWLLAQYCLVNKPTVPQLYKTYRAVKEQLNFPDIDFSTISKWLNKPEQRRLWTLMRDGSESWQRQYQHYLKLNKRALFPNAYWVIDGSKLDLLHYWDNQLKMAAKLKIDPVFDVYSEKIIGYSISHTEDHTDHFRAMKMAVENTEARPFLLTYDNQSGHKMSIMQDIYSQVVAQQGGTHYPHRAGQHGPAELLFKNLQTQFISRWWFSDRQSPMSKTDNSKVNIEEIKKYKDELPDIGGLIRAWEIVVEQWNAAPHSLYPEKSRNEVYETPAPMREDITADEIRQIFWITTKEPRQYTRGGIKLAVGGEVFEFEVYDKNGLPDTDFRKRYIGQKFYRRYDPDNFEKIELLQNTSAGWQVIATAELKKSHIDVPVLMKTGDKSNWDKHYQIRHQEKQEIQDIYDELVARTGIDNDALVAKQNAVLNADTEDKDLVLKYGGLAPKQLRSDAESSWLDEL